LAPAPPIQSASVESEGFHYIKPSKKDDCSLEQCGKKCGRKESVVVTVLGHHWVYCELGHFSSSEFSTRIKYQIAPEFEVATTKRMPDKVTCIRDGCKKRCPAILLAHGRVTRLDDVEKCLAFCSINCFIDHMKLMKVGTWAARVKLQEGTTHRGT